MSAQFGPAVDVVLRNEGGAKVSNHPADPGGTTKYGISLRFLKSVAKHLDVDLNDDLLIDPDDITMLPESLARELYFRYFWEPVAAGHLISQPLATKLLDASVLSGPRRGTSWLEKANFAVSGRTVEGTQPNALRAVEESNRIVRADGGDGEQRILAAYRAEQLAFYRGLVQRDPKRGVFLKGWTRRATSC